MNSSTIWLYSSSANGNDRGSKLVADATDDENQGVGSPSPAAGAGVALLDVWSSDGFLRMINTVTSEHFCCLTTNFLHELSLACRQEAWKNELELWTLDFTCLLTWSPKMYVSDS